VADIEQGEEAPEYKSIIIKPCHGGKMRAVNASYESLYCTICSEYKIENGNLN
jgi:hypothetical protein